MPRVIHFEIFADDTKRAIDFYKKTFGWKIEGWEGGAMEYWLVATGEKDEQGINGAILRRGVNHDNREPFTHRPATVNTIGVPSLDEALKKVEMAGRKVIRPRTAIPSLGWFAYCEDTEGNMFGVMQNDPSAK